MSCPHEAEFLSYYLILSRGTFGSFKASTANVVRLLNQMSTAVGVSEGEGGEQQQLQKEGGGGGAGEHPVVHTAAACCGSISRALWRMCMGTTLLYGRPFIVTTHCTLDKC